MKRLLFLVMLLLPFPAWGSAIPRGGGGGGAADGGRADCVDIDQDGNCEIDGTDNTNIQWDPDDDTNFNVRMIDNAGGWTWQRFDTTWKDMFAIADDTGNLTILDNVEGTVTFAFPDGDHVLTGDIYTLECTSGGCSYEFGSATNRVSLNGAELEFFTANVRRLALRATRAIWFVGQAFPLTTETGTFSTTQADYTVLADATSGAFSVTLVAAAGLSGFVTTIKKIDASANAVTIDGNAAETIDGAATVALSSQFDFRVLVSDGSNWHVIGTN